MMQHNAYSWQINAHHFECDELSYESVQFAIKVILFLEKLSYEEKHQFVEAMFSLFDNLNLYNFSDLSHISYKHIMNGIKEITLLKPKTRNMLLEVLHMLWLEAKRSKEGIDKIICLPFFINHLQLHSIWHMLLILPQKICFNLISLTIKIYPLHCFWFILITFKKRFKP